MWAASLSDIFNAILDGIGRMFFGFWHADIMPSENVIVPILLVVGLGVTAYWTYALARNTRGAVLKFQTGEYWIDKGAALVAAFFCPLFCLMALAVFVTCIIFLGEFLFTAGEVDWVK